MPKHTGVLGIGSWAASPDLRSYRQNWMDGLSRSYWEFWENRFVASQAGRLAPIIGFQENRRIPSTNPTDLNASHPVASPASLQTCFFPICAERQTFGDRVDFAANYPANGGVHDFRFGGDDSGFQRHRVPLL